MNDNDLRKLLKSLKTIVMIGVSTSPIRASFFVARYFILYYLFKCCVKLKLKFVVLMFIRNTDKS